ncbi:hypothetical protein BCV70DRAFT_153168, partial [Testicularia cyperi]
MTSLSQYASRFLSSGLATSVRPGVDDDHDAGDPSDPLFYSHASVSAAPFSHPAHRNNPYGPDYSLSSSDGLPTPPAHGRPGTQSGILHSLTGASRFGPASFMAQGHRGRGATGGGAPAIHDSMIREIDDEEDVDLWRDDRRLPGLASRIAESTSDDGLHDSLDRLDQPAGARITPKTAPATASVIVGDAQDPFLADGDLDNEEIHSGIESKERDSSSATDHGSLAGAHAYNHVASLSPLQAAAKTRGWMAHGSTTINTPTSSIRDTNSRDKGKGRDHGSGRHAAGIYANRSSHLREALGTSPASSRSHLGNSMSRSHRSRAHRSSHGRGQGLYSIYDEHEERSSHSHSRADDGDDDYDERHADDRSDMSRSRSSSISASSVTDSDSDRGNRRNATLGRNRARNMASTLREPLLHGGFGAASGQYGSDDGSGSETEGSVDVGRRNTYRSNRSRTRSNGHSGHKEEQDAGNDDIYVYPSPPARSGWGPWANRLAFGKYRDKTAIATFAAAIGATVLIGLYMSWGARTPAPPKTPRTRPSSYYTITRSLPILILLTLVSFGAALGNLVLLRNLGRLGGAQVLRTGLMGVPVVLGLGWTWAFAGSFIYDDEAWTGGAWSTTGLRLISVVPLILAVAFARRVWSRRKALARSIAVLELSCSVVLQHPGLLVLAAASLGAFIVITIPFLYLFTRLFLVGHFGRQVGDSMEWHTDTRAAWLAWATLLTWLWTWAVLRGIQRVTVAGVVSQWYFTRITDDATAGTAAVPSGEPHKVVVDKRRPDEDDAHGYGNIYAERDAFVNDDEDDDSIYGETHAAPGAYRGTAARRSAGGGYNVAPNPTEVVRASFARATGPALGSICMAALILAVIRTLAVMAETARRISTAVQERRVPKVLQPLTHVVVVLAGLAAVLQGYSDLALVYVGVTGDGFWASAKKSAQLATRRGVKGILDGLVINLVLDLTAVALSFLAGVAGFLFSAHRLHVPADAPLVGVLCALLPYWCLRMCADVLTNASETLYLCYAIDFESHDQHCPSAARAFTA